MNKAMSIYAVHLYKLYGIQWVFDDPSKKIVAEAFVSGADTLIDKIITEKFGNPDDNTWFNDNYIMRFSGNDFPGSHCIEYQPREGLRNNSIDLKEGMEIVDSGSYWVYNEDEGEHLLWLCETLDEYFGDDDKLLFFDIIKGDNE
jgi:hypothetical protein